MAQTALRMLPSDQPTFTAIDSGSVEYTVRFTYYLINGRIVRDIDIVDRKIVVGDAVINTSTLADDNNRA